MNRFQNIIRIIIIGIVTNMLMALIGTTAMAQVQLDYVKIPADTRLYLQTLENGDKKMRARSMDVTVTQQEAQLLVCCAPDADTICVYFASKFDKNANLEIKIYKIV